MAERSLEGVASFVRDLGSACSAVRLVGDMLLAGSHDGLLLCLDAASGGERWRLQAVSYTHLTLPTILLV